MMYNNNKYSKKLIILNKKYKIILLNRITCKIFNKYLNLYDYSIIKKKSFANICAKIKFFTTDIVLPCLLQSILVIIY